MHISSNLRQRVAALPRSAHPKARTPVVLDFAMLIEMHQDADGQFAQFRHSFVRGECAPISVSLWENGQGMYELVSDDGQFIPLNSRQKFMTNESWTKFVMDNIMTTGYSPLVGGVMPTRRLRDARAGHNYLLSFRQIVSHHDSKGAKGRSY